MNIKEARQIVKQFIKDNNLRGKVSYRAEDSISFDFIFYFTGDDKYLELIKKGLKKLVYSDPENDMMSDYFGCHNSMLVYNGRVL